MDELELAIFDMAGTTVEDRGEVPFAFTAALAGYGNANPWPPSPTASVSDSR